MAKRAANEEQGRRQNQVVRTGSKISAPLLQKSWIRHCMQEDELFQVSSMLEELVASGGGKQPSDSEVRAAVWEACSDSGALQILVDLLNVRMADLLDASGPEDSDTNVLRSAHVENAHQHTGNETISGHKSISRNVWASIDYKRGWKQLTRLFLKEAEDALQLALGEGN